MGIKGIYLKIIKAIHPGMLHKLNSSGRDCKQRDNKSTAQKKTLPDSQCYTAVTTS